MNLMFNPFCFKESIPFFCIPFCGSLVSGLIHFINQQKDNAIKLNIPTYITIKLFSDRAKIPIGFNNNDITKIQEFSDKLFRPKGATRLIDTCFESITELSKRKNEKHFKIKKYKDRYN